MEGELLQHLVIISLLLDMVEEQMDQELVMDITGNYSYGGGGGTATAGGSAGYSSANNYRGSAGSFGQGGNGYSSYGTGGGGGWYGGGGGTYDGAGSGTTYSAGGGGSGYVYTSSTASQYPSGCLLNSSYYLTSASTTGNNRSGNGYARITLVE